MKSRWLALGPCLAPLVFTIASVTATIGTPGYSSTSQTLSQLGTFGTVQAWVFNAGATAYALLVQPLGWLFFIGQSGTRIRYLMFFLVVIYGTGVGLAGVFISGSDHLVFGGLTADIIHGTGARLGFTAITILIFSHGFGLGISRRPSLFSIAIGIATVLFAIPFAMRWWPSVEGLFQRGFFTTTMLWIFVVSLTIIRGRTHRATEGPPGP